MSNPFENICKRCNHPHEKPTGYCGAPCRKAGHLCNCPRFVQRHAAPVDPEAAKVAQAMQDIRREKGGDA